MLRIDVLVVMVLSLVCIVTARPCVAGNDGAYAPIYFLI